MVIIKFFVGIYHQHVRMRIFNAFPGQAHKYITIQEILMNSLLLEINKQADEQIIESKTINDNIDFLTEYLSMSTDQLNEAVTTWLAKVRNAISNGKLDPNKKDAVIKILGALSAITNPDLADALDEKGDLGTILWYAGDKDKTKSNAGLKRLEIIGNHPSVKTFIANAANAVQDPQSIDTFTKQIQARIEPVMNKRLGAERKQ